MRFDIGDLVELVANGYSVDWDGLKPGMRGTVASGPGQAPLQAGRYTWSDAHLIQFDGFTAWIAIPLLRKLDSEYDGNRLGEWDLCPYKPPVKQPVSAT